MFYQGEEKIGVLTHNAGVISLPPSLLKIGGIWRRTLSTLSVTLSGLASNTRYQIYAIDTGGVVSLVISTNENSVGPAGATRWALVGSFYSNNIGPAFGAFVKITGVPETEWWTTNNVVGAALSSTGTLPTLGTLSHNLYRLKRIGEMVFGEWVMRQTAQGTAGTGTYIIVHPFPILDSYYRSNTALANQGYVFGSLRNQELSPGTWRGENPLFLPANILDGFAVAIGMVGAGSNVSLGGDWGPIMPFGGSGQVLCLGIDYKYRVSGWSNTPIKDL